MENGTSGLGEWLSSRAIRAVSFDLFDTLISVDLTRLPQLRYNGADYRSTLPLLADAIAIEYPTATRIEILNALAAQPPKPPDDCREVPDQLLFEAVLTSLGTPQTTPPETLAARLCEIQMDAVSGAVEVRPGAPELLRSLREAGFLVALLSNLSHADSIGNLLRNSGLSGLFDAVVLSERVGFCKPHPAMFRAMLEKLDVSPQQVIHIGDDAAADVWGAGCYGIQSVWLNPGRLSYPASKHRPTWTILDLRELLDHIP